MRRILRVMMMAAAVTALPLAESALGDTFVDFGVASTQIDARVGRFGGDLAGLLTATEGLLELIGKSVDQLSVLDG